VGGADFLLLSVAVLTDSVFTESVWRGTISACGLHAPWARMRAMDVISVLLGVLMFAILIALVYGIDAI
jgi:RsiW-degrading membrane proteinase PrsW (M82 family)